MARQYPDAPICLLGVSAGKGAAIATHCMDGGNGGDSRGGLFVTVALTRLDLAGTNSVIRYAAELEHPKYKRSETAAQNIAGVVAIGAYLVHSCMCVRNVVMGCMLDCCSRCWVCPASSMG